MKVFAGVARDVRAEHGGLFDGEGRLPICRKVGRRLLQRSGAIPAFAPRRAPLSARVDRENPRLTRNLANLTAAVEDMLGGGAAGIEKETADRTDANYFQEKRPDIRATHCGPHQEGPRFRLRRVEHRVRGAGADCFFTRSGQDNACFSHFHSGRN